MAEAKRIDWRSLPESEALEFLIEDLGMPEAQAKTLYAIETGTIQGDAVTVEGDDPYLGISL